jgi:site-specific DNA recombinase
VTGPRILDPDSATALPWQHPAVSSAPWAPRPMQAPAVPAMVPVAWAARVSDEEAQDPTLSLPRQLDRARAALPAGFVIVAHFFDVESGRMELDQRGLRAAYAQFDITIPRDGGINDLLTEARRPDRRFVAVVCESIDRISRITRIGTTIEWELEQAGVALLAVDEGIHPDLIPGLAGTSPGRPKKATPVLTRRVKQAISEWYVLNMLELSWEGFIQHTIQGWNVGKPPYGYLPEKIPHPVPARRAEGRTKHRLVPDPLRGPAVSRIFHLRGVDRLGYDAIADQLNTDPPAAPPPEPTGADRAVGRWTGSAVREILCNPKYTGYMVWNRRRYPRPGRRTGKVNPPTEWTWSPTPTHEPLVTRELFDAASPVAAARGRQGSRTGAAPNTHPQTKRSYLLRSYVIHDACSRRMFGKTRKGHAYLACQPDARHHASRDWYPTHPKSIWVREDALLAAVHDFFATRILGPDRRRLLASQLNTHPPVTTDDTARRRAQLAKHIHDLRRRQTNLLDQLEHGQDDDLDPDTRRAFRKTIRDRFADLAGQIRRAEADRDALRPPAITPAADNADLIDRLPQIQLHLAQAPDELQRALYDAFDLTITYNRERHHATLRVTITADAVDGLANTLHAVADRRADTQTIRSDGVSLVLCGPGRIRTCDTRFRRAVLYPLSYEA